MYSQVCTHYRRPDVSNVTWITPQQLDGLRLEAALNSPKVQVRELPPQARPTSDENAEAQNLLARAPQIVAAAAQAGLVQATNRGAVNGRTVVRGKTGQHRQGWSAARRARYRAARRGMQYRKTKTPQA